MQAQVTSIDTPPRYRASLIQANHWLEAARRLLNLDALAGPSSWKGLELYVQPGLRRELQGTVEKLVKKGDAMLAHVQDATLPYHRRTAAIEQFKRAYCQVEQLLDFYADALVTRTTPETTAMLKACDYMAGHSMRALLQPLGIPTPAVITYLDSGIGASIFKAGMPLWDNLESPVAAIKVTRHNLLRPTALIHEAGHQVAHLTGWNAELAAALRIGLKKYGQQFANSWAAWASEIAADIFAFVHAGFASVAALHDVVDGASREVFRYAAGDPHPISFLRVLIGTECCRQCYGPGVWDQMERQWKKKHPLTAARPSTAQLVNASLPRLPEIVRLLLQYPFRGFRSKSITQCIDAGAAHPEALQRTAAASGEAFYTSAPLLLRGPMARLAWNGYQIIAAPAKAPFYLRQQQAWMLLLGNSIQ